MCVNVQKHSFVYDGAIRTGVLHNGRLSFSKLFCE